MAGGQKKTGKGRLDKFYRLAKEQGYRARSAFKLVQLNRKYNFLHKARVLIDLCAAPGGWLQVAAKYMPLSSLVIGVDLVPIKPIPNVITLVDDITTEQCRTNLRRELKTWKADVVLHDGSPNMGQAWLQDAYSQADLTLKALRLACEFLVPGGTFVTKVFRSKDYNALLWVFNQLFKRVEVTKPSSSRNVSAEIYVVGTGYLAPKQLDPKFLDAKHVFSDVEGGPGQGGKVVDIFRPEKAKRHRDGYEEGANILFKTCSLAQFVSTQDPVTLLATHNAIVCPEGDEESADLNALPSMTDDLREHCKDLRVLGKRDFKELLRWRTRVLDARAKEAAAAKEAEKGEAADDMSMVVQSEAMDEAALDAELQELEETANKQRKREKRRKNALKAKLRERIRLNMEVPNDTALMVEDQSLFSLKRIRNDAALDAVAEASADAIDAHGDDDSDRDAGDDEEGHRRERDGAAAGDYHTVLEDMLDNMYEQYLERKSGSTARKRQRLETIRAEKARVSGDPFADDSDGDLPDGAGDDEDDDGVANSLVRNGSVAQVRSRKAALWFSQPLFQGIAGEEEQEADSEDDDAEMIAQMKREAAVTQKKRKRSDSAEDDDDADGNRSSDDATASDDDSDDDDDSDADSEASIEEVPASRLSGDADEGDGRRRGPLTAEEITVATMLRSSAHRGDLLDRAYNRFAFNDDGLPAWFALEEAKFTKPAVPVTKEAVQQYRDMTREIDARPIKKVAEAKARKKRKMLKRAERVRAQASAIAEQEDLSEKAKAKQIEHLYKTKLKKREHTKVQVVVAKGSNKGSGRPKGVKGRYKMVDARLRKDLRGQKRADQRRKKSGRK